MNLLSGEVAGITGQQPEITLVSLGHTVLDLSEKSKHEDQGLGEVLSLAHETVMSVWAVALALPCGLLFAALGRDSDDCEAHRRGPTVCA